MAEMSPEWFTQGPAAELQVWRALRNNLPDAWTVWHRFAYSSVDHSGQHSGEIDFVCFHPRRGLAVIEVKGGALSFEDGRWFQAGHVLKRSPFAQLSMARSALLALLPRREGAPLRMPVAAFVWMPAVNRVESEPPEGAGRMLYLEDLAAPEKALTAALPLLKEGEITLSAAQLKALLTPTVAYALAWQQRQTLADARLLQLTLEQARTLDAFAQFPRLRVRGCAGSGKTLLALRRAYQLTSQGKRVLLLCFNLLLAAHLRKIAGHTPGLRIDAVNDLFLELLNRTETNDPEFWHRLAEDAVPEAARFSREQPYDAIIIDEGQDFSPRIWKAVKALVPPEAEWIIFYDPVQNIFQRSLEAMPVFPWPEAVLTRNCRNTRTICEALQPYVSDAIAIPEETPQGEAPECYVAASISALRARLIALLERLTLHENIPLESIVIMGAHARARMALTSVEARFPDLRYFTYRKFKGLEAPVLILLDVDETHPLWDASARYTAISRAVHKLIILSLEAPAAESPASETASTGRT